MPAAEVPRVLTVGHSNQAFEAFLATLESHGVRSLVDIRTVPRSLRVPWSAGAALAPALAERGIAYRHEPDLGGLQKPRPDSRNTAWENAGFRGYADWMETAAFEAAARRLLAEAAASPTCVMCAEAVPWRCHRGVLADWLVAHGARVLHLMAPGKADEHRIRDFARIRPDGTLAYPAAQRRLDEA